MKPVTPSSNLTPFQSALTTSALRIVTEARKEGTTLLGFDSLFAALARELTRMPGVPVGTNATYYVKGELRYVITRNRTLRAFILL